MSTPNEYTDNFKSNLIYIFLSVRAKLKKPLCPRTQCNKVKESKDAFRIGFSSMYTYTHFLLIKKPFKFFLSRLQTE